MTAPTTSTVRHNKLNYRIPDKVMAFNHQGRVSLSTSEGGRIWIDRTVHDLWAAADQHTSDEIVSNFRIRLGNDFQILCGLACLAEAGLLERSGFEPVSRPEPPSQIEQVSIILVSYNSSPWLKDCLESIRSQTLKPLEIIVVDNASADDSAEWISRHAPNIRLLRLEQTVPLAKALNHGIKMARGSLALLLNPDVRLFPDAIARMVEIARSDPACAAVGAKLRLLWAPSFLNGLGNLVGSVAWGTDIALGHLDLGQFDDWKEIPSACFAAALIPMEMFQSVGMLDEGFPMYYEDSEWCYRARLIGYTILAAPHSICLHAFSSQTSTDRSETLTPSKLQRVAYGRLRFIARINSTGYGIWFLFIYLLEDTLRCLAYLILTRWRMALSLLKGWRDFIAGLPEILRLRKEIQSKRKISDRMLYSQQKHAPVPLIESGCPILTWDVICTEYGPRILSGKTRLLPEFPDLKGYLANKSLKTEPLWKRASQIWKNEGKRLLIRRMARQIQWRLMQFC